jgi:RimJ/RimL family protein N-acetyltransferase
VPPELETERLLLRSFRDSDLEPYGAMCADPEVMRFLGEIEERASGAFLGRAGLHYPEGWPDREVNWALARPYWGRGFAFEAAAAVLAHAFETLKWDRATSLIDPANRRSIRLAERLGERFERQVEVRGFRVGLYSVTRDAWKTG